MQVQNGPAHTAATHYDLLMLRPAGQTVAPLTGVITLPTAPPSAGRRHEPTPLGRVPDYGLYPSRRAASRSPCPNDAPAGAVLVGLPAGCDVGVTVEDVVRVIDCLNPSEPVVGVGSVGGAHPRVVVFGVEVDVAAGVGGVWQ